MSFLKKFIVLVVVIYLLILGFKKVVDYSYAYTTSYAKTHTRHVE